MLLQRKRGSGSSGVSRGSGHSERSLRNGRCRRCRRYRRYRRRVLLLLLLLLRDRRNGSSSANRGRIGSRRCLRDRRYRRPLLTSDRPGGGSRARRRRSSSSSSGRRGSAGGRCERRRHDGPGWRACSTRGPRPGRCGFRRGLCEKRAVTSKRVERARDVSIFETLTSAGRQAGRQAASSNSDWAVRVRVRSNKKVTQLSSGSAEAENGRGALHAFVQGAIYRPGGLEEAIEQKFSPQHHDKAIVKKQQRRPCAPLPGQPHTSRADTSIAAQPAARTSLGLGLHAPLFICVHLLDLVSRHRQLRRPSLSKLRGQRRAHARRGGVGGGGRGLWGESGGSLAKRELRKTCFAARRFARLLSLLVLFGSYLLSKMKTRPNK